MDPEEEGDFVELDEGDNEAPMDSDGDDFEETEEERQMQFEELDENGNFRKKNFKFCHSESVSNP